MKASVKAQTQASLVDYTTRPRPEWVRRWPAMAVLAVSAISWSEVSTAINAVVQKHADDMLSCWPFTYMSRLKLNMLLSWLQWSGVCVLRCIRITRNFSCHSEPAVEEVDCSSSKCHYTSLCYARFAYQSTTS